MSGISVGQIFRKPPVTMPQEAAGDHASSRSGPALLTSSLTGTRYGTVKQARYIELYRYGKRK